MCYNQNMDKLITKILRNNKILYTTVRRSESGFSNAVYLVDDSLVVKVCDRLDRLEKLNKEINFYRLANVSEIPGYIADGECEGKRYLIIEQIKGLPLYKVWHKLDKSERVEIIKQIASILAQFHRVKCDFLPAYVVYKDWLQKWQNEFETMIARLKECGFDMTKMEKFANAALPKVMKQQHLGLVYNDAHFDNFIYDGDKVRLIDFDRILYGSIDYELLIIKSMVDNPPKFANEEDEENAHKEDYVDILPTLKKYCGEMFDFEYLDDRLMVYQTLYNLDNALRYNDLDCVRECLDKFYKHFGM